MNSQIKKMNNFLILLKENINVLNKFFKNERYLYILLKQYNGLINNIKSIDALLQINNAEDAFTIFRKYLETYLIMMSVLKNKNIVDLYVEHDKFIGKKVCKVDINEVKQYCSGKPDGYLEYGYLESVIDTTRDDFKYTMRDVANAGGLHKFMNYKHITIHERCCIANFLDLGWSLRKIAKYLNRNASTISREIKRNS